MAVLERLLFHLDVKGAEKVAESVKKLRELTYKETKATIGIINERNNRELRAQKRKQKPLDEWNKKQAKYGAAHARVTEKTLTAQMSAEQRVLYFKRKQARLDAEYDKTIRQSKEWYAAREKRESNLLELTKARGQLERQSAVIRNKSYREYQKVDSLSAYDKRHAEGEEWLARKEQSKKQGEARAIAIATKRQRERERAAERLSKAAEKLEKAAEKQKALAEKQAKQKFDQNLRRAANVASSILKSPTYLYNAIKYFSDRTSKALRAEAADFLAGGKTAQEYDVTLAKYGGGRGEGVSALRKTASSIGGLRYGDTSFIRTAGRFGIGGITPNDSPSVVRRKILDRLKTMPMNEAIYAASQLGISDAELRMAKDTGSAVGGVGARTRALGGSAMSRDIATQYALTDIGSTWLNEAIGGKPAALLEAGGALGLGSFFGGGALYKGAKFLTSPLARSMGRGAKVAGRFGARTGASAARFATPYLERALIGLSGATRAFMLPSMLLTPSAAGVGEDEMVRRNRIAQWQGTDEFKQIFNIQNVNVTADNPKEFGEKLKNRSVLDGIMQ